MSTSLSQDIAPLLPYLRRYARALAGSQKSGDAYVRACLQALVGDQTIIDRDGGVKIGLYRLFHVLWNATIIPPTDADGSSSIFEQTAQERLSTMAPESRQTLLLSTLEGFSIAETARIIDKTPDEVSKLIKQAIEEIDRQTKTDVLIIEDEPLISMDLTQIVESLGHSVTQVARSASEASGGRVSRRRVASDSERSGAVGLPRLLPSTLGIANFEKHHAATSLQSHQKTSAKSLRRSDQNSLRK